MGPGDILKIGVIVLPLVMFLAYVGTAVVDNTKTAGTSMDSAADGLSSTAGSSW
ncbi:hypothetical protein SAMN05428995_10413 [Loktanella sp. DSM 29012]|uniref:Uncharacterized protein n=1 Tax=Loktanella gaetbuli TaxID=2881335 RepID=A0ABS8BXX6_9RHOB|nr:MULTISPECIES: hypothetical protein [Loktanella]MCB5200590.1 hypothetical protein [Loktanella gaetbuli]SEQ35804.1 hypothetical protein SAMN05428995_10413 [Loktanella sp. DSM 29012]